MKILIISPYYYPDLSPRAHRWSSIAEVWARQGHEVHVLSARHRLRPPGEMRNGVHRHVAGFHSLKNVWSCYRPAMTSAESKTLSPSGNSFARRLNDGFLKPFYFPDDAFIWYPAAVKALKKLTARSDFDLLISSALPFTAHLAALKIKKRLPYAIWIADTGDPFAFQPEHPLNNTFLYGKLNRHLERKVAETADFVTLTHEGARELYEREIPEAAGKFKVIHPLYRPPQKLPSKVSGIDPSALKLGYFGSFFPCIREPRPMLRFWAEFVLNYPELSAGLELHFYGNIALGFMKDFRAFPVLRDCLHLHGLVSKKEVAVAMQRMNFLLNVGNTTTFQLPSKSVDYLAAGRPVINFCRGEKDTFARFLAEKVPILNIYGENYPTEKLRDFVMIHKNAKSRPADITPYTPARIGEEYLQLFREGRRVRPDGGN